MLNFYSLIALSPKKMPLNKAIACENKGLCIPLSCEKNQYFFFGYKNTVIWKWEQMVTGWGWDKRNWKLGVDPGFGVTELKDDFW